MGDDLEKAFLISLDGSRKTPAKIKAPREEYLKYSPHALIKNELFIFGCWPDKQEVRKLFKPESNKFRLPNWTAANGKNNQRD